MQNITVGRYQHPTTRQHWQGWIEPEDRSWIMFIRADGAPIVYLDRDPDGAIIEVVNPDGTKGTVNLDEEWTKPDAFIRESETDPIDP